jgi:hypothetical protein
MGASAPPSADGSNHAGVPSSASPAGTQQQQPSGGVSALSRAAGGSSDGGETDDGPIELSEGESTVVFSSPAGGVEDEGVDHSARPPAGGGLVRRVSLRIEEEEEQQRSATVRNVEMLRGAALLGRCDQPVLHHAALFRSLIVIFLSIKRSIFSHSVLTFGYVPSLFFDCFSNQPWRILSAARKVGGRGLLRGRRIFSSAHSASTLLVSTSPFLYSGWHLNNNRDQLSHLVFHRPSRVVVVVVAVGDPSNGTIQSCCPPIQVHGSLQRSSNEGQSGRTTRAVAGECVG